MNFRVCVGWVQGSRGGVTKLLQETIAPHMHGVHCVSHRTNLAVKELSQLPVIQKIENILHVLHKYFARSPKRHIEFTKLTEVMETKDLKILRDVKTRWLSMVSPLKRVMSEYRTLIQKMQEDSKDATTPHASRELAKTNFSLLVDVSVPIALTCFLPLLETVHYLVKFSQQRDIFICDYLGAVKVCQGQLYTLYSDPQTSFRSDAFREMTDLLGCRHGTISMVWETSVLDLNESGEHLAFNCGQHTYPATILDTLGRPQQVSREALTTIVDEVKSLYQGKHDSLVSKFL
jgi:hypothetical protein